MNTLGFWNVYISHIYYVTENSSTIYQSSLSHGFAKHIMAILSYATEAAYSLERS
jgi:hypothetical protein